MHSIWKGNSAGGKRCVDLAIMFLLGVSVISALVMGSYFHARSKEAHEFKSLDSVTSLLTAPKVAIPSSGTFAPIADALAQLKSQNEQLIGWLWVPSVGISYPVMQSASPEEYYLNHSFSKKPSLSGTPFADALCDPLEGCDNVIIYGHNMYDDTMFSNLLQYEDKGFYREHKTFEFYTLQDRQCYEIVAAFEVNLAKDAPFEYNRYINFADEEEFLQYQSQLCSLSFYGDADIAYGDELMTLSTCSKYGNSGRFAVVAKKIN